MKALLFFSLQAEFLNKFLYLGPVPEVTNNRTSQEVSRDTVVSRHTGPLLNRPSGYTKCFTWWRSSYSWRRRILHTKPLDIPDIFQGTDGFGIARDNCRIVNLLLRKTGLDALPVVCWCPYPCSMYGLTPNRFYVILYIEPGYDHQHNTYPVSSCCISEISRGFAKQWLTSVAVTFWATPL